MIALCFMIHTALFAVRSYCQVVYFSVVALFGIMIHYIYIIISDVTLLNHFPTITNGVLDIYETYACGFRYAKGTTQMKTAHYVVGIYD